MAERLNAEIVPELERNVQEYLAGEQLTEIRYTMKNGQVFSIPFILRFYSSHDFWSALEGMQAFFTRGDDAVYSVRRVRL